MAILLGPCLRNPAGMSRYHSSKRERTAFGELPPDLYVAPSPWPRLGRPVKHEVKSWRVIDDWPARVPVTEVELDVFEAWFGDLFDELLEPAR